MKKSFLIGRKVGMTRIFCENGDSVPVSVVSIECNRVVAVKTKLSHGYSAVQVCFSKTKPNKLSKSVLGVYAKASIEPGVVLREFVVSDEQAELYKPGDQIDVSSFPVGGKVSVCGITRGHGFAGAIKRHGFASGDKTHGNSVSHNKPGSTGMCQDPGRVFPGKKMPGHMGNVRRTVKNLLLFNVDSERQLLLIKGAIPGAKGNLVYVESL